jgi:hypothetical protein
MDRQQREDWLRAVYQTRTSIGSDMSEVTPILNLNPVTKTRDRQAWVDAARYWEDRGFVENVGSDRGVAYALVRITSAGIRYVEEGEQEIPQPGPTIHIAGSVYASPIATSGGHVQMQNFFTFGDLDHLIEERGGENRDELHRTAQELRKQLAEHDTVSKGWLGKWLVRHSRMLNEHAWIVQPLAVLLLTWGTGQPPS